MLPDERNEIMERRIKRVNFKAIPQPKLTKVAAYARVSSGKDAMLQSLSAQVSYYSNLIQKHPGWQFAGVYADEAITGTGDSRPQFQEMLEKCRQGEIDLIITKSISRFARNTVTLLQTVRELKQLGVDVLFEEQNIHTLSSDGELMITILASYAQEESRSVSENQKWRVRRNFENGCPWNGTILGYRMRNGQYVIVKEEADVVRRIYEEFLDGFGTEAIARHLNDDGVPTRVGDNWTHTPVQKILRNYNYTGNLILQKTYRDNYITKKCLINNGEKTKYIVKGSHEPIISLEIFERVQEELAYRAQKCKVENAPKIYPFSSKLVCTGCGKHYRRRNTSNGFVWICSTFKTYGKAACPSSKQIPESCLEQASAEAMGTDIFIPDLFEETVDHVNVKINNMLEFIMKDGSRKTVFWKDHSRADSWTPEMREQARQRRLALKEAD